jgi:hypothetical protein
MPTCVSVYDYSVGEGHLSPIRADFFLNVLRRRESIGSRDGRFG